jgi:hypothetical protein
MMACVAAITPTATITPTAAIVASLHQPSSGAVFMLAMVIGLNGYTTVTFDAVAQAAFVTGVAVLGGFQTSTITVIAVIDNNAVRRRSLLTTVGGLGHVASLAPDGARCEAVAPLSIFLFLS